MLSATLINKPWHRNYIRDWYKEIWVEVEVRNNLGLPLWLDGSFGLISQCF